MTRIVLTVPGKLRICDISVRSLNESIDLDLIKNFVDGVEGGPDSELSRRFIDSRHWEADEGSTIFRDIVP